MRAVVGLLMSGVLLGATAQAQVINGEGTYEGSTLHNPPPEPADARHGDRKRPANESAQPRDERHD